MIPQQFHAIIGDQLCSIKIEFTYKIEASERTSLSLEITDPLSRVDTSASLGEGTTTGSARVGFSDWPSHGVVLLLVGPGGATHWRGLMTSKNPPVKRGLPTPLVQKYNQIRAVFQGSASGVKVGRRHNSFWERLKQEPTWKKRGLAIEEQMRNYPFPSYRSHQSHFQIEGKVSRQNKKPQWTKQNKPTP